MPFFFSSLLSLLTRTYAAAFQISCVVAACAENCSCSSDPMGATRDRALHDVVVACAGRCSCSSDPAATCDSRAKHDSQWPVAVGPGSFVSLCLHGRGSVTMILCWDSCRVRWCDSRNNYYYYYAVLLLSTLIEILCESSEKKTFFDFLANGFLGPRRLSVGLCMTDEVDGTQDYVYTS